MQVISLIVFTLVVQSSRARGKDTGISSSCTKYSVMAIFTSFGQRKMTVTTFTLRSTPKVMSCGTDVHHVGVGCMLTAVAQTQPRIMCAITAVTILNDFSE